MLTWVYPQQNHETFEASTFILGQWLGNQSLLLNGKKVSLLNQQFAQTVSLSVGVNTLSLTDDEGTLLDSRIINRLGPVELPTSGFSLSSVPEHLIGVAGTKFFIDCLAAPGQVKTTWLDAANQPIGPPSCLQSPDPLSVDDPVADTRETLFGKPHWINAPIPACGVYRARLTLPKRAKALRLRWERGQEHVDAFIAVEEWQHSHVGIVTTSEAVTRKAPSEWADRLTPWPKGAEVEVLGVFDRWAYCRWHKQPIWVQTKSLQITKEAHQAPVLESIEHQVNGLEETFIVQLSRLEPPKVSLSPEQLQATWHVSSASELSLEKPIELSKEKATLTVQREGLSLCGYRLQALDCSRWELTVRWLPANPTDWIIVLDAGHGGEEHGTHFLDGTPEKTVTLAATKHIENQLRTQGFQHIHQTRTEDKDVSLQERTDTIQAVKPHLCVSVHFNALPDGRNPMAEQGACTFYYHRHAKPIAQWIQNLLTHRYKRPDYGLLEGSYVMTRESSCLSVLVEIGFAIHPAEANTLISYF